MNKRLKIITFLALFSIGGFVTMQHVYAVETTTPTVISTQQPNQNQNAPTRTERILAQAKEIATRIFDNQFLNRLNALRAKVSSSSMLGNDAKTSLLAKVDTEIAWFAAQRDSISGATTLVQVRTTVKDARVRFDKDMKDLRRLNISTGFVTSLQAVITNLQTNIVAKVQEKINSMTSSGIDMTAEQNLINKANVEIQKALTSLTAVKNSTTLEDTRKNFNAAKLSIKEARQNISEAMEGMKKKLPQETTTPSVTVTPTPSTTL